MRVTFNMIYSNAITNMNSRLSDVARLNEQTATQKKLNRPSDDPAGMSRALDLRSTMSELEQYQENLDTAEGWLTQADDELRLASEVVTRLKEICTQGSTGTYTDDQREMMAEEARQLMEQLVGIANSEYAGDSIFAGSRVDGTAYEMGLAATVADGEGGSLEIGAVTGSASDTTYVEFIDSGTVGTDELHYRYTTDGGDTWTEATLAAGETTLDCGGVRAEMAAGSTVVATDEAGSADGTAVWLRPAAIYQGNTTDEVAVRHAGNSPVSATAEGDFSSKVVVRVDSDGTLPGPLEYSYSADGGATWSTGHTTTDGTFTVPGGHVTLEPDGGSDVYSGDQFTIQPENGAINLEIGPTSTVQINNIGKDIFGGLYTPAGSDELVAAEPEEENLLETVGAMIGYLETNNQDGLGECLEQLELAQERLTVALGGVGGRESRVEYCRVSIDTLYAAAETNLSGIEDADTVQLAVDLAKAEYAYEAVLSSSSRIMQMSLLDYL
ncbi:flagellar hook-associated protein FlgL [Megalodesulfovibrio paquesii]